MAYKKEETTYRNLQEQVEKNRCDIQRIVVGAPVGIQGPKGDKGDQGIQGETGIGTRIYVDYGVPHNSMNPKEHDLYLDAVTGSLWEFFEESWGRQPIANIRGPQGIIGQKGTKGDKGDVGPKGERGEAMPALVFRDTILPSQDLLPDPYTVPLNTAYFVGVYPDVDIYYIALKDAVRTWVDLGKFDLLPFGTTKGTIYEGDKGEANRQAILTKVDIEPLQWQALPEKAIDKKSFYAETIPLLRTANNKIFMIGKPDETPIKEFFEIWGKPKGFRGTHVYITISSISNHNAQDSFVMIIHSSNYSNMFFYVVSGYSFQLVGDGSGWISFNEISENGLAKYAKTDGDYEKMVVGSSYDLVDPAPGTIIESTFDSRVTANGAMVTDKGVAREVIIGGNTIVKDGVLVSAKPSTLTSIGTNLCDQEFEFGSFDSITGEPNNNDNNLFARTKNYIKVVGGKSFICKGFGNWVYPQIVYWEYDDNDNLITHYSEYNVGKTHTLNASTTRLKVSFYNGKGYTKPFSPFVVMFGTQAPTEYIEYQKDTLVTEFEKYATEMRGVGTARDTLTKKAFTQNMGIVDLGTLPWIKTGNNWFKSKLPLAKIINYSDIGNAKCSIYTTVSAYDVELKTLDKIIAVGNENPELTCELYDSAFVDKNEEQVKSALSGVMLVYELKEPIVTKIEPERAMSFNYQNGGIEFWNDSTPARLGAVYKRVLVKKLSNLKYREEQQQLDDEQNSRIKQLEDGVTHLLNDSHDFIDFMTSKANCESEVAINYSTTETPSKVALNTSEVNKLKGIRVWYDFQYNGNTFNTCDDIRINSKSKATYLVAKPLPTMPSLIDTNIVLQYNKNTGALEILRADSQPTSTFTTIVDVKGIE